MIASLKAGIARLQSGSFSAPSLSPALLRSIVPMTILAIGLTALVLMFLWREQSSYKPVFGARENVVAGDMISALEAGGIPYRIHPDSGQVLVPEEDLGRARMQLAARGVTARLPSGLELADRNDPLGASQFVQDIRFRRGLEGELTRSITAIDAVGSARVHLSIARSSSFVAGDGSKSTASVIVSLKPDRTLGREQIAAIVNLVAGSVSNLKAQDVSLVDQAGNLLSARVDLSEGFDAEQADEPARRYQEEVRRTVRELLVPVVGDENFKVGVTAELDNDRIEETHEKFGDSPKVTSEAMRDEQDRNRIALGVPGSLSNRPAAGAEARAGEGTTAQKNATTRQYAYDRSITHIKRARARLSRLNVAVVLNDGAAPSPGTGWTPEQIAGIERILRNGLGINAERGDGLVVSSLAFPARPQPLPWWQQRDNVIDGGSLLLKALAVVLGLLFVVRPLMKALRRRAAASWPVADAAPAQAAAGALPGAGEAAALPAPAAAASAGVPPVLSRSAAMPVVPLLENYDLPPPGSPVDVMVDHLKVLAGKEPERVAEVVKQWVQSNGRNG